MRSTREIILGLCDPVAQRYAFARLVLGEDRMSAAAIAGACQSVGLMDAREYDLIAERWQEEQ